VFGENLGSDMGEFCGGNAGANGGGHGAQGFGNNTATSAEFIKLV